MHSLHLIGSVGISSDGESFKQPDSRSLLKRLWPAVERDFQESFDGWFESEYGALNHASRDDKAHLVTPVLKRFRDAWAPPESPVLPGAENRTADPVSGERHTVEFYWVGAAARHAGTIVHRWLERLGNEREPLSGKGIQGLQAVTRRWARELGVPESDIDLVCERVEMAISDVLKDDKGRWIINGEGARELALTGMHDGRIQSVVIDRVRIDDDGTHWIIDYKTSSHEGGDLAGFLQQESDRYRDQLSRYAAMYRDMTGEAVRTALYFPLLREFVEVDTSGA